ASEHPRGAAQARADGGFGQRPGHLRAVLQILDPQRARLGQFQPHPPHAAGASVLELAFERVQMPMSMPRSSASDSSAPAAPRSASASATKPSMPPLAMSSKHSAR